MKCQVFLCVFLFECSHEKVDLEAVEKHAMDRISIRHFFPSRKVFKSGRPYVSGQCNLNIVVGLVMPHNIYVLPCSFHVSCPAFHNLLNSLQHQSNILHFCV